MFPDRGQSFNGFKHLTEKVTSVASLTRVRVVVDHHAHNAHPITQVNKVKDLALIFLTSVFTFIKTSSSVKNILSKRFFLRNFFTYIHLMRRLSSMVNLIAVTTLLLMSGLQGCQQRISKKTTNYFYVVRVSISLARPILSEIVIQIGYFFLRVMGVFFLNSVHTACQFRYIGKLSKQKLKREQTGIYAWAYTGPRPGGSGHFGANWP